VSSRADALTNTAGYDTLGDVEWLLTESGKLVAVDVAEEMRRLYRAAVELTALNRVRIAQSRALAQATRRRLAALRLWRQPGTSTTVQ